MRSVTASRKLGNKLRRLAGNLSSTSHAVAMEDFVARFFATGQPPAPPPHPSTLMAEFDEQQENDENNNTRESNTSRKRTGGAGGSRNRDHAQQQQSSPSGGVTISNASQSKRREAKSKSELHPEEYGASTSSTHATAAEQQHHQEAASADSTTNIPRPSAPTSSSNRSSTTTSAVSTTDDAKEVERIRNELFQKQQEQPAELQTIKIPRDNRSLVEIFDEVVSAQMINQPDEDVITIVVRANVISERRLFQYLVCGEMWFHSFYGADTQYMQQQDWDTRIAGGAKLAIDALVKKKDENNSSVPPAICTTRKEDLNVYFSPSWKNEITEGGDGGGVGITLDSLRKKLYLQSLVVTTENNATTNNNNNSNIVSPQKPLLPQQKSKTIPARKLVPNSIKCFSPDTKSDVLTIPFDPDGMKLAEPVGGMKPGELQTLTLQALSDKRTGSTQPIDPEVGEIVAARFRIDQKVGSATFSDAFAVTCTTSTGPNGEIEIDEANAPVACIKCIKPEFFDQSLDEVRLLSMINSEAQRRYDEAVVLLNEHAEKEKQNENINATLSPEETDKINHAIRMSYYENGADACHVVRLADAFYFRHRMFVVTELLKENLYETTCAVVNEDPYWFNVSRLAMISKQVITALEVIHSLGLIHCDVKPENVMVQSHSRCRVKLIDFGSSSYLHERFSSYVQSRSYRAPEVIFGAPYDGRADVWSVGGMLVELAARGEILFRSTTLSNMLARMVAVCGPLPQSLAYAGAYSDCVAMRSGTLFSQYGEVDDERFEQFEQHPYLSTAQTFEMGLRMELENELEKKQQQQQKNKNSNSEEDEADQDDSESVNVEDFVDKSEIWLHFPVFNGIPKEQIAKRQELWKIDRAARGGETNAAWSDIYEPNGRIEQLLESTGGWDIAALALSDACADDPVCPELLFLDFVKKCLILEPTERPTTLELLKHPFISVFGTNEEDVLLRGVAPATNINNNNNSQQQQDAEILLLNQQLQQGGEEDEELLAQHQQQFFDKKKITGIHEDLHGEEECIDEDENDDGIYDDDHNDFDDEDDEF